VHLQLTGRLAFQLADGSREVTGEEVVLMNVMVSAMSYS
jgi:hypothetical protein